MTKVLLTGASGFIAKHILRELLENGYEVRASIRSEKRKSELEALFPDAKIEFVFLDLAKDEGWAEALNGMDVLVHTASPFPFSQPKDPQELIRPAVDGTLRALNAAKAAGIKRVILTSSCVAIYKDASKPVTESSGESNWTTPDDPSVNAYEASKTLAEKAAWDFVAENPEIALTTINPGIVLGPAMDKNYGTSLNIVEQMMTGKMPMVPAITMPCVDVRDVAKMHVAAIELEATKGERFAAAADNVAFIELGNMIKAADPQANTPKRQAPNWLLRVMGLFVRDIKAMLPNLGRNLSCSGAKAEKTLGFTFIPIKDAMAASAKSIRQFAA
ncbi:SDR family oxidoreductase [Hoeflea sp.]|uniref:SDR family oxidoreductase n=1 Tax=Hoeflea sp. TaxID=1940281 RepID=UPI003B022912